MKRTLIGPASVVLTLITCLFMWTQATPASESPTDVHHGQAMPPGGSMLPTATTASDVLNATGRHGDWLRIPVGSETLLTFAVYPDRADKAPVLIISQKDQPINDWMRAVADQAAGEGFIALVPDSVPGLNHEARINAVRKYVGAMPPANGKTATLTFTDQMETAVDSKSATFELNQKEWTAAIAFLNAHTDNHPTLVNLPPHSHGGADLGVMAQAQAQRPCNVGSLDCKADNFVSGFNTASSTLAKSTLRSEWVDIPVGNVKVHTKITYPNGTGKFPLVVSMSGANGLNDWQQAVGDQLAREGFLVVAPDMHSGLGPNGGNFDSFQFPDEVVRAGARVSAEEAMRRYKAAREYALKLPEASGKSASIGFCGGGTRSFNFAAEVPELNAAVVYYGAGPPEAQLAKIKAPVLGLYGEIDTRIISTVPATTEAMKRLGKIYETHIYKGATHSFLQYQNLGENTAATMDAWPRTIAFLKQHTK